jgi:hypothetical protein
VDVVRGDTSVVRRVYMLERWYPLATDERIGITGAELKRVRHDVEVTFRDGRTTGGGAVDTWRVVALVKGVRIAGRTVHCRVETSETPRDAGRGVTRVTTWVPIDLPVTCVRVEMRSTEGTRVVGRASVRLQEVRIVAAGGVR